MSRDERMLSGNWQPEDRQFAPVCGQVACLNTLVSPNKDEITIYIQAAKQREEALDHVFMDHQITVYLGHPWPWSCQ